MVSTHGNLLALTPQHSDPSIGFEFWQELTTPDVYVLHWPDDGEAAFRRSVSPEGLRIAPPPPDRRACSARRGGRHHTPCFAARRPHSPVVTGADLRLSPPYTSSSMAVAQTGIAPSLLWVANPCRLNKSISFLPAPWPQCAGTQSGWS